VQRSWEKNLKRGWEGCECAFLCMLRMEIKNKGEKIDKKKKKKSEKNKRKLFGVKKCVCSFHWR
jgi:hypothetical protein